MGLVWYMGFRITKVPLSFYPDRINVYLLCLISNMASSSPGTSIYISLTRPVLNAYKWIVLKAAASAISLILWIYKPTLNLLFIKAALKCRVFSPVFLYFLKIQNRYNLPHLWMPVLHSKSGKSYSISSVNSTYYLSWRNIAYA